MTGSPVLGDRDVHSCPHLARGPWTLVTQPLSVQQLQEQTVEKHVRQSVRMKEPPYAAQSQRPSTCQF